MPLFDGSASNSVFQTSLREHCFWEVAHDPKIKL